MKNQAQKLEDFQKEYDFYRQHREDGLKHWRAWGSWFSWGSPVGLGLFFISIAFTLWILAQVFGW